MGMSLKSGNTFEVLLYDSKKPKKRIETKTETNPPVRDNRQEITRGGALTVFLFFQQQQNTLVIRKGP
jgi:hypothetical protein